MKSVMDRLDEHFDTTEIPDVLSETTELNTTTTTEIANVHNKEVASKGHDGADLEDDYKQVRSNMYNLIDKGTEALDSLLVVAKGSDHPRAYEVVASLMSQLKDLNKEVINVQSSMKHLLNDRDMQTNATSNAPTASPAVVIVNSTAEVLKNMKANIKDITNDE